MNHKFMIMCKKHRKNIVFDLENSMATYDMSLQKVT